MNTSQGRLHELDSLRALAAIGVVGWHYTNHMKAAPLAYLMAPFYRHGLLLVDFFFVLSGFVLARTYWTDNRAPNLARNLRDRVARIYPLHFAMLLLVAALQWTLVHPLASQPFIYSFNDARHFVLHLFLLNSTGLESGFGFNAPAWSISTEMVVNVLFLIAIAFSRRIGIAILGLLFVLAASVVLHNGLIGAYRVYGIDNDIFRTIFGFVIGVALYRFDQNILQRITLNRLVFDAIACAAIAAFLFYCVRNVITPHSDTFVAMICFPLVIIGAAHGIALKGLLRIRPLVFLGTISYSIYLVHFPCELAVHTLSVALGRAFPYGNAYFFIGFMLLVVAVASLTYRFIEMPGKQLLKKIGGAPLRAARRA